MTSPDRDIELRLVRRGGRSGMGTPVMVEGWLALGAGAAVVFAAAPPLVKRRSVDREWRRVAAALGATVSAERGARVMRAQLGSEHLDATLVAARTLDITIQCAGAAADLAWTRRRVRASAGLTGDEAFDRRVEVFGPEPLVVSILDGQARRDIAAAAELGAELRHRTLRLTWEAAPAEMSRRLATVLQTAIRAASLSAAVEFADPRRIARAANFDGVPGVRCRALRTLVGLHQDSSELEVVLQRSLGDEDVEVVAVAAMALGEDGLQLVHRLITDPKIADATREELVDHLLADSRAAGCPPDRYLALRRLADDCASSVHTRIRTAGRALASEVRPRHRSRTDPGFAVVRRVG